MATSMFYDHAPTSHDAPYYVDSMMVFDQINLMSYTMWMGDGHAPFYSGFDTPIDSPHVANYDGWWLNHQNGGPLNFEVAGYPKSKLGIGMSFEGTRFIPNSGWGSQYSSWGFTSTVTDPIGWGYAAIPAANRQYEPHAKANYVYDGSTYWYSFQDTNSVKAIAKWAVDRGWGGLMIYDIGTGWDETAVPHDALLRVAWSAAGATPDTTTEAQATSRKYLLRRR
jgi:GH18 family chitinase